MITKLRSTGFWAKGNYFELTLLLILGVVLFFNNQGDDNGYVISGKINGQNNKRIFLSVSISPWKILKDSTTIIDSKFTFKGQLAEPAPASLRVDGSYNGLDLFLDNSTVTIDATNSDLNTATITGSKENDLYTSFNKTTKPYLVTEDDVNLYSKYETAKDVNNLKKMQALFDDKETKRIAAVKQFAAQNPDAKVSAYLMIVYLSELPYQQLMDAYQQLSSRIKDSGYGKYLQKILVKSEKTAVGRNAEDFVQNDVNGNPVHLSSFRGKYVLLDFWASWCEPCRLENPYLVSAYKKYNSKGFDILSVALEQPDRKENWTKAISDDGLRWTNVSDFKYLKNDVAVQYGISNIPANLLLDREGRIIAKNLSTEKLEKKLEGLFNETKLTYFHYLVKFTFSNCIGRLSAKNTCFKTYNCL